MSFPSAMPASRLTDPMDAPALRWGVLGTGWIAEKFTGSLRRNSRQQVVAAGFPVPAAHRTLLAALSK